MVLKKVLKVMFFIGIFTLLQNAVFAVDYIFKIKDDAALLCDEEVSLMTEECFGDERAIAKDHGIYITDDLAIIEKYTALGLVEYYEQDAPAYLFDMPNTSEYMTIASGVSSSTIPLGRSFNQLNVQALWSLGFTGKGIVVGVIDSGVYPHADLAKNILPGENVSSDVDSDASKKYVTTDGHGHGTCVSGLIAAHGSHYRGIAYEAKIVPLKAFTDSGSGSVSNIVKGIYAAVDTYGCDVINMSCGAAKDELLTLKYAVQYAVSKGIPIIAAAGNRGSTSNTEDADYYPASYSGTISVANITVNDTHWQSSQENDGVDISAPGRMIYGLKNNVSGYIYNNGTSFASPMVAGVAALILGYDSTITPAELKSLICETATDLGTAGWDMSYGHGKVNCAAIAERLLDGKLYRSDIVEYKGTYNIAVRNGLDDVYSPMLVFASYSGNKMTDIKVGRFNLAKGQYGTLGIKKSASAIRLFELSGSTLAPLRDVVSANFAE